MDLQSPGQHDFGVDVQSEVDGFISDVHLAAKFFPMQPSFCHMLTFIFGFRGLSAYTLIHNNLGLILHLPNMLILA